MAPLSHNLGPLGFSCSDPLTFSGKINTLSSSKSKSKRFLVHFWTQEILPLSQGSLATYYLLYRYSELVPLERRIRKLLAL